MLELAMASGRPHLPPSIFFDQLDYLSNLQRERFYAPGLVGLMELPRNRVNSIFPLLVMLRQQARVQHSVLAVLFGIGLSHPGVFQGVLMPGANAARDQGIGDRR